MYICRIKKEPNINLAVLVIPHFIINLEIGVRKLERMVYQNKHYETSKGNELEN